MNLNESKKYEYFINRGNEYYKQKDYKNAILMYNNAIQLKPGINDNLYYKRGCVFFNVGNFNSAIQDFTEAINLNHDKVKYYYRRGQAYFRDEHYDCAIKDLEKALILDPGNHDIEKDLDKARKANEPPQPPEPEREVTEEEKIDINNLIEQGKRYSRQKDYKSAIKKYTEAIKLNRGADNINYDLYYRRGSAYYNAASPNPSEDANKYYKFAIRDFSSAIKLNGNDVRYYHYRGLTYSYDKQYKDALADLLTALESEPDNSSINTHINDVLKKLRINPDAKPDQIQKFLKELEKKGEGDPLSGIVGNESLRNYMEPLIEEIFKGFDGIAEAGYNNYNLLYFNTIKMNSILPREKKNFGTYGDGHKYLYWFRINEEKKQIDLVLTFLPYRWDKDTIDTMNEFNKKHGETHRFQIITQKNQFFQIIARPLYIRENIGTHREQFVLEARRVIEEMLKWERKSIVDPIEDSDFDF
jgi:tetratricopeptide (TPR) repeat protein